MTIVALTFFRLRSTLNVFIIEKSKSSFFVVVKLFNEIGNVFGV